MYGMKTVDKATFKLTGTKNESLDSLIAYVHSFGIGLTGPTMACLIEAVKVSSSDLVLPEIQIVILDDNTKRWFNVFCPINLDKMNTVFDKMVNYHAIEYEMGQIHERYKNDVTAVFDKNNHSIVLGNQFTGINFIYDKGIDYKKFFAGRNIFVNGSILEHVVEFVEEKLNFQYDSGYHHDRIWTIAEDVTKMRYDMSISFLLTQEQYDDYIAVLDAYAMETISSIHHKYKEGHVLILFSRENMDMRKWFSHHSSFK